jgi:hypothetical protein
MKIKQVWSVFGDNAHREFTTREAAEARAKVLFPDEDEETRSERVLQSTYREFT